MHKTLLFPDYSQNVWPSRQCNGFRKIAWLWSSEASSKPSNPFINFHDPVHRRSHNDLSFESNLSHNAEIRDSNARFFFILSYILLFSYYLLWHPTERISFFQPHYWPEVDSYINSPFSASFFILFLVIIFMFSVFWNCPWLYESFALEVVLNLIPAVWVDSVDDSAY